MDLGALLQTADPGLATVARHAGDDRLAHAVAVGSDLVEIEAGPTVSHEDLQTLRRDLGIDADRWGAVAHGVG